MLSKINSYFSTHAGEKEKFAKELNFINTIAKQKPSESEKKLYSIYPYPFTLRYNHTETEVFRDEKADMFYVFFEGKKMYYHNGFTTKEDVQMHFMSISAEQDAESPHRYFNGFFSVTKDDVVADLGAAEGNFALTIVNDVKELYLLEADPAWADALNKTFEPWKEKVHIIQKYVGGCNDNKTITLDELFKEKYISVIKMDIEGAEVDVLKNAQQFISERSLKMIITTYHRKNDATEIKELLESAGYHTMFSNNYMLYIWDNLTPPYFRNGLITASK